LKILQISSAQAFGGGEQHLSDLTNELARRGHEVYAVVRPHSPLTLRLTELPDERIKMLPLRNALDVQSAYELARFVKQHQVEIIHAHMARDYSLAAYAARRSATTKFIITRHVLFRLNRLHRHIMARATRVIAVSEAVAAKLGAQNLLPVSRISIVQNGVDVEALAKNRRNSDRDQFCRDWDLPEDSLLVGTVGQLNPLKGHDLFLRAAALVIESIPQARFVVAGGDVSPNAETLGLLRKLIVELQLQNHVRLLGEVENVKSVLAALDVFVSSSRTESFGLAIVEAMASGLPVIATSTDGAREVVEPDHTGLIVPIGDHRFLATAIIKLLADAQRRTQMGNRGQFRAREHFDLQRMVDAIETIYRTSLSE